MNRRGLAQLVATAALVLSAPLAMRFMTPRAPAHAASAANWDTTRLDDLPASHRDIAWPELMPPGWDPLPQYKGVDASRLRDADPLATRWQADMQQAFQNAPVNSALDGMGVRLRGYVVPLSPAFQAARQFLLVPYFGACIHTPPPPSNQIVLVTSEGGIKDLRSMRVVAVTGSLRVTHGDFGIASAGYELAANSVQFND